MFFLLPHGNIFSPGRGSNRKGKYLIEQKFKTQIDKMVWCIIDSIMKDKKYARGGYLWWMNLSADERNWLETKWKKVIRSLLFEEEFKKAIQDDCLDEEGYVKKDSRIVQFMYAKWFGKSYKRLWEFLKRRE